MSKTKIYDVVVIGGGVVGCAILRYLSQYQLKILLLEKEADLAEGISKANSGVIHAGFNVPEGTMKARMNVRGLELIYDWLEELNVSHRKTGKLVVGLTDDDKPGLEALKARGEANGTLDLEIVDADRMYELEPLAAGKWALYSPHTGILSPYQFTVAMAECAWQNGAEVQLEAPVTAVARQNDGYVLDTPQGRVHARWVVNSAGLFSDEVARLAGITDYTLFPYRGEYHITDTDDTLDLK
ncbi:FAD-dependent oxidoreductase, partial [bacterium]|nr:FAD-dependent oxidoreductase [bacterium]